MVSSMGQFNWQGHVCRKDVRQKSSILQEVAVEILCPVRRQDTLLLGVFFLGRAFP